MRSKNVFVAIHAVLAAFAATILIAGTYAAAQETVLFNFDCGTDGCEPSSNLIFDATGNLYGTTPYGGESRNGMVFELSPQTTGGWGLAVLHSFNATGDGYLPQGGLVSDAAGNLYGTTQYGGLHNGGTAFEMTLGADGVWTETLLHSFGKGDGSPDGNGPYAGLALDAAGNLYGTTMFGGVHKLGTVFELSPSSGGVWGEKILHTFSDATDGSRPYAGLTLDTAGNLYGTTTEGGAYNGGTVFELTPQAGGQWAGKLLYSFGRVNGTGVSTYEPYGGVVFDQAGNLYGTTYYGGGNGGGVVYELTPSTGSHWKEVAIHNLGGAGGSNPLAGVTIDAAGILYGTTNNGGNERGDCGSTGCGVVYELTPTAGGGWTETVLFAFDYTDGAHPSGTMTFGATGNVFGTTTAGGPAVFGTVFEIAH